MADLGAGMVGEMGLGMAVEMGLDRAVAVLVLGLDPGTGVEGQVDMTMILIMVALADQIMNPAMVRRAMVGLVMGLTVEMTRVTMEAGMGRVMEGEGTHMAEVMGVDMFHLESFPSWF